MLDEDFILMTQGKLKPQNAYMNGKLKLKGNLKAAMKFKPSVFPKGAKLWAKLFLKNWLSNREIKALGLDPRSIIYEPRLFLLN